MAAPVRLREDFDGPRLRASARRTRDAGQLRRRLATGRLDAEAAHLGQQADRRMGPLTGRPLEALQACRLDLLDLVARQGQRRNLKL